VSYEELLRLRDLNELTPEQMRLFMVPRAGAELYDIEEDPFEFTNLAADPTYADVAARLDAELDRWMEETNDVPVSRGYIDNLDIFTRTKYGKTSGPPEPDFHSNNDAGE
jgi:arylsulfatase A-like enzyme